MPSLGAGHEASGLDLQVDLDLGLELPILTTTLIISRAIVGVAIFLV